MGDFLSQHSSPNHGLWEAMRVSTHPPEKVGGRKEHYFLEFMYVDVARDFVDVAPELSLYLDFQIFVFVKLFRGTSTEVLASRGRSCQ